MLEMDNLSIVFYASLSFSLAHNKSMDSRKVIDSKGKRVVTSIGEDRVQRMEVGGGEYYFEPNHIVVQVNKPVELLVRKAGGFIPHNIIVQAPEAGIDFKIDLKDEFQPIRFTPTKTGRYVMYCDKSLLSAC